MIRFIAHFDGQKLSPDEPVNLPTDTPLQVTVEEVAKPTGEKTVNLKEFFDQLEAKYGLIDGPEDWAENHDHYIAEEARGHRDGE
jgi:hypothetical protein